MARRSQPAHEDDGDNETHKEFLKLKKRGELAPLISDETICADGRTADKKAG
jgi:hypothetical protein